MLTNYTTTANYILEVGLVLPHVAKVVALCNSLTLPFFPHHFDSLWNSAGALPATVEPWLSEMNFIFQVPWHGSISSLKLK